MPRRPMWGQAGGQELACCTASIRGIACCGYTQSKRAWDSPSRRLTILGRPGALAPGGQSRLHLSTVALRRPRAPYAAPSTPIGCFHAQRRSRAPLDPRRFLAQTTIAQDEQGVRQFLFPARLLPTHGATAACLTGVWWLASRSLVVSGVSLLKRSGVGAFHCARLAAGAAALPPGRRGGVPPRAAAGLGLLLAAASQRMPPLWFCQQSWASIQHGNCDLLAPEKKLCITCIRNNPAATALAPLLCEPALVHSSVPPAPAGKLRRTLLQHLTPGTTWTWETMPPSSSTQVLSNDQSWELSGGVWAHSLASSGAAGPLLLLLLVQMREPQRPFSTCLVLPHADAATRCCCSD